MSCNGGIVISEVISGGDQQRRVVLGIQATSVDF